MNIFFDLDGTLIDSRERLYILFQKLVKTSHFNFDEYWALKRNRINHKKILKEYFNYLDEDIDDFENKWMEEIESIELLALDKPFNEIEVKLKELKEKYNLYVITSRQFKDKAISQLENFNMIKYFKKILVTEQKYKKAQLILNSCNVTQNDYMIGDTGKDIQVGKSLGMKTIAVLSGFMNKEKLLEYNPDRIVDNVTNINFD